jgi:histone arginine demethylase JMJD6
MQTVEERSATEAVPATKPGVVVGQAAGIDRRDRLPYDDFVREYVEKQRPVIVSNAFPQWKAHGWTPASLKARVGARPVLVDGKQVTLGDHLDRCVASTPDNPAPYMREQVIRKVAPELADDLMPFCEYALPNWLRGTYPVVDGLLNRASEVELFIGGAGSRLLRRASEMAGAYGEVGSQAVAGFADLHYDPTGLPVLLCQVYGRKEWVLFSPDDSPYLYANGTRLSLVANPDNPDLQRFPLFARAKPIRFVQEPGEAVYLPAFWWHATRMLTVSIAVSSTFAHGPHWETMIEDVLRHHAAEGGGRAAIVGGYLRAAARLKKLGGRAVGSRPFEEHPARAFLRKAKSAARSLGLLKAPRATDAS